MDKSQAKVVISIIRLGQLARDLELEKAQKHQDKADEFTKELVDTMNRLEKDVEEMDDSEEGKEVLMDFLVEMRG